LNDELVRTIDPEASVSVRVLAATDLTREAARRHATTPAASVALARALMGGVLLASEAQDGERVQLQFRGDGPFGSVTITADAEGAVRGYLQHPGADPPLDGKHLGVGRGMGLGALAVERNHPSWKQPYSGVVPMRTGEIAQDLAHYLLESEQKPSAVALGVYLGPEGEIEAAGGYLIQALPGADDVDLAAFEQRVAATAHPSELLRDGASASDLLVRLLGAAPDPERVDRSQPRFLCQCDADRVRRATILLGRDELRDIVARGEVLEVRCAFCADVYRLSPDEVGSLLPDA
jgi:molecular chaperone Hsp33